MPVRIVASVRAALRGTLVLVHLAVGLLMATVAGLDLFERLDRARLAGWWHRVLLRILAPVLGLGLAGGLGFWLALGLFADLMQRVDAADVPAPLRGTPITLLCAGLMGVALMGFNGLVAP